MHAAIGAGMRGEGLGVFHDVDVDSVAFMFSIALLCPAYIGVFVQQLLRLLCVRTPIKRHSP